MNHGETFRPARDRGRKKIPRPPKKTINSINSIKWFLGVRRATRKAENESMHDLVMKQRTGRPRESPQRRFKLPNPTGKWHLMGIDISRGKISIGVSATIYTISAVAKRHSLWKGCALSGEGVVSSHSVTATGLVSRHGVEFCT